MTVSDLCGKIILVFFMNKIPVSEVNLLISSNLIMTMVAVAFVVYPVKAVLCVCSLCKYKSVSCFFVVVY